MGGEQKEFFNLISNSVGLTFVCTIVMGRTIRDWEQQSRHGRKPMIFRNFLIFEKLTSKNYFTIFYIYLSKQCTVYTDHKWILTKYVINQDTLSIPHTGSFTRFHCKSQPRINCNKSSCCLSSEKALPPIRICIIISEIHGIRLTPSLIDPLHKHEGEKNEK